MKKVLTILSALCVGGLALAFAMYAGWMPMMGASTLFAGEADDWQFVEPAALTGVMDAGAPVSASYAQRLEEKGDTYSAFEAYRDELSYHIGSHAHEQVLVLAPKLVALAAKLDPPPLVPASLPRDFEACRKSLDEARTMKDLAVTSSNFRYCTQSAPWIPDLYYHLSIAENAADELRAADRHLQVYLCLKPDAASRSDIQRFQASLQKSIAATHAWENSLGMRFVPVSGTAVRFCIWETRAQDYGLFVEMTGHPWSKSGINDPAPASMLNLYDAAAFCEWLTEKERREGVIGEHDYYRLPTHEEWTIAAGAGPEEEPDVPAPNRYRAFPWGEDWPPPAGAGNLMGTEATNGIEGYEDGFTGLAPVGSFEPNLNGLHDMAGNVKEWCADSQAETARPVTAFAEGKSVTATARGGSLTASTREELGTMQKHVLPAFEALYEDTGFRCVLTKEPVVLSLFEVLGEPVTGGKSVSGDFAPGTRFTGPEPVLRVRDLRAMWVATNGRHPKVDVEFESLDQGTGSSSALEGKKLWFISFASGYVERDGTPGTVFFAPAGIRLEGQRLTLSFSTQDEFNDVRSQAEKRICPRFLFEVARPK